MKAGVIMENVEGLIKGEAWSYVQRIYKQLHDIGYQVKHWLCKGENMGVPQKRHRVFFIALRSDVDFNLEYLDMSFNYEPIIYGEIKDNKGEKLKEGSQQYNMLQLATPNDHCIEDVLIKHLNKSSCFTDMIVWDNEVSCTLTSKGNIFSGNSRTRFSSHDILSIQTFPEDFYSLPL